MSIHPSDLCSDWVTRTDSGLERANPWPKPFSHEQGRNAEQREEFATLEGHDADIPTEDQTSTPAAVAPPEQPEAPQVAHSTPPETVHAIHPHTDDPAPEIAASSPRPTTAEPMRQAQTVDGLVHPMVKSSVKPKPSPSAFNGNDASSPEGSDLEKEMHVEKG